MVNIVPHINTGELRDVERVRRLLASPDIHVAYLLGDGHHWIDYALEQPNIKLVVVRRWNIFNEPDGHSRDIDGDMHQRHTPEQVFAHFQAAGHTKYKGNKKIRWIWGWNEPVHNPNDQNRDLIQLNAWQAKIGELFASNGYGAALGGYAAAKTNSLPITNKGVWRTEDISHPDYTPYIAWMQTQQHEGDTPTPPVEPPKDKIMRPFRGKGYNKARNVPTEVRIRKQPSLSGEFIAWFPADPVVTTGYISESAPITNTSDPYTWQYYEGLQIDGQFYNGYMATELVEELPLSEQKVYYDLDGLTFYMTPTEWHIFAQGMSMFAAHLPTIEGRP